MSDLISRKAVLKHTEKIRQGVQMMDDIRKASIIMNGMDLCEEAVRNQPSAQPERLTNDDFETIRIHLNAYKEKLCNQQRWKEAEEYQRIIDRFMAFASAQSEQQHGRIFQEIVVEYPSISTYPEYKGKPYFSIKYTENGQEFIGYGTCKPEVLSEYLKEYFMPYAQPTEASCWGCNCPKMERLKEQKTFSEMVHLHDAETHDYRAETHACDCISREDVEQTVEDNILCYTHSDRPIDQDPDTECHKAIRIALGMLRKDLRKLPSAQPERKRGEWTDDNACPFCGFQPWYERDIHTLSYCPNCGADMR